MKFFLKKLSPFWFSLIFTPFLNSPASAGIYDALCENMDCKIVLEGKGFTGPRGFIPAHRVVQWYTGGSEDHNRAAQAAGAGTGAVGGAIVGGIATCWTINCTLWTRNYSWRRSWGSRGISTREEGRFLLHNCWLQSGR